MILFIQNLKKLSFENKEKIISFQNLTIIYYFNLAINL